MKITFKQAITAHQKGRLEEAESLYRSILENQPTNSDVNNNLGVLLHGLGRLDEAEASYRRAISLKPDYEAAHNNLGSLFNELNRLDEAEASYRRAIELKLDYAEAYNNLGSLFNKLNRLDEAETNYRKSLELRPDYVEAHYNLGATLKNLGRLDEAEISYRKSLELKPDHADAYNNLGNIFNDLGRLEEAEISYKKAIELKPGHADAHNNLSNALRKKSLLVNIFETRKSMKKNTVRNIESSVGLTSNPFITHRSVETKLLKDLYKGKFEKLDKVRKEDARYGNGKCSDFNFFKNDFFIVKNIEADLINIMKEAVKSDIYIFDSFLNIYKAGSGTTPHHHIGNFDKTQGLVNQKYSLTYYLSVGDQNCSEPGNLQLYSPSEEIRLTEGMVVIIPANRKHCAVYNGGKDRIMIGINFYSLL